MRYAYENKSHRVIASILSFLEYSMFIPKPRKVEYHSMGEPNSGSYVKYKGFTIMCCFTSDKDYNVSVREGDYELLPMGQTYSSEWNCDMEIIKRTIKKSLAHRKSKTIYKASNIILEMLRPYFPDDIPEYFDIHGIKSMDSLHETFQPIGDFMLCLCLTNTNKGTIKLAHNKIISDKKQEITTIHLSTFGSGIFEPFTQAQKNAIERLIVADLKKNKIRIAPKTKENKNGK